MLRRARATDPPQLLRPLSSAPAAAVHASLIASIPLVQNTLFTPLDRRRAANLAANAALAAAWLALHAPALRWIGAHVVRSPLSAGLFLVTAALLSRRLPASEILTRLAEPPRLRVAPLALLAASAIGTLIADRFIDVSILGAALFALGSYGLVGLFTPADRFRRALPAALLLTALLPFGDQAETYAGFNARLLTARAVAALLAPIGYQAMPVETILVLENGAAHIDLPCSGVRSLSSGLVFFLAGTCVLGLRPGLSWALTGALSVALLLVTNVIRVGAVVLLAGGLGLDRVAEVIHAPLGVLGFAAACAITLAVMRRAPRDEAGRDREGGAIAAPRAWPALAMAAALALLSTLHVRRAAAEARPAATRLALPAWVSSSPLALTSAEADLFRRWGGAADKRHIRAGAIEGALLVVVSRSWRAHHEPEVCLAGSGVRVEGLHEITLEPGVIVRGGSADGGARTAIYWFQSPARVTPDLGARVWDELSGRERRWAQVSLLIDSPLDIESTEGRALIGAVRAAAASALTEETP